MVNSNDLQNEDKPSVVATKTADSTKGQIKAKLQTYNFADAVDNSELIAEVTSGKQ